MKLAQTFRSFLLASLCILPGLPSSASAQAVVNDPIHTMQTMMGWLQQQKDTLQKLEQLRQQYAMLSRTYSAISHATDVGGIANALGGVARTYLPEASGTLSMIGQGASLYRSATSIRSADQLFIPQVMAGVRTSERWLAEMERRQNTTANAKSVADAGLRDMEERTAQLTSAQRRLAVAQDGTEVAAVNGLIQVSQANLVAHQVSIDSIRLALHAEDRAERQRGEQMQALGAHEWSESTRWAVDALGR